MRDGTSQRDPAIEAALRHIASTGGEPAHPISALPCACLAQAHATRSDRACRSWLRKQPNAQTT